MNALDKIIKDYRKTFRHVIIGDWISAALIIIAFALSGVYVKFPLVIAAVICTVVMCGIAIWQTLGILVLERRRLVRRLDSLPEGDKEKILSRYESVHDIGKRWFLDEYLLFHRDRHIELLRYDTILSAEPKGFKLYLELPGGKTERLGLGADENPAMIVAALRSKNPQISVKLNGQVIEKMENRKDSTE